VSNIFALVLSSFVTISVIAIIFSLLTYTESEHVRRAINRRLRSLDQAVRPIFRDPDNALDHVGGTNDDIGAPHRARRRRILLQADPAPPFIDTEVLTAEQEAQSAAQDERRRWTASDSDSESGHVTVVPRPANVSFSEWLGSLVPLNTPARDRIIASEATEPQNSRPSLTSSTRGSSTRLLTRLITRADQSELIDELLSVLHRLRPALTPAQIIAILANFNDTIRYKGGNQAYPISARFRQDFSFSLWLAARQIEPSVSEQQMDEIMEQFRGSYEALPVPENGVDADIMTIVEDMPDVDVQRYDRFVGIPMPPLQHPQHNGDDTSSTFVHPSSSRPHTPSVDLDPNSGSSSVSNWSGTTLVDSGQPSTDDLMDGLELRLRASRTTQDEGVD
jgi:hypothetical protein